MLSESEKEQLENFMLTQGTGSLSVEFRNSWTELEEEERRLKELEDQALITPNDAPLQEKINDRKRIIKHIEKDIQTLIKEYNVSLERLWDGNVPNIEFFNNSWTSAYSSNYPSIPVDGSVPSEVFSNFQPQNLSKLSTFVFHLVKNNWTFIYDTESMIVDGVKLFLDDIFQLLNLQNVVRMVPELTLDGKRSDLWILKTASGVPFLPIECKKPRAGVLEDLQVIGQCHHYMQQLRSSFGQQVVYGIITTLEEWRILSLPNISSSSTTPTSTSASLPSSSTSSSHSTTHQENTVCASQIFSLNSKVDTQPLITAISKSINLSYSSSHAPVPLLSRNRSYIIFKEDKILWRNISEKSMKNEYIKFSVPNSGPQLEITILRSFIAGADGNVYLGLTQNFDLVVVKKFTNLNGDNPNAYANERKYWPLITDKATVPIGSKNNILVLPFAFPCLQHENNPPYFDFNLNKLGSATQDLIEDDRFTDLSNKFINYYNQHPITPQDALKSAVLSFSKKKCVHEDIKWRHVALLPQVTIFRKKVKVVGLTPIFIDLSRVHDVPTTEKARNEMSPKLNFLLNTPHSKQRASEINEEKGAVNTRKRVTNLQITTSSSSIPSIPHIPQDSASSEIKLQRNKEDSSSEYYNLNLYSISQSGWRVGENFGEMHSSGQQKTQDFHSQDEATQYMNKLAEEKRKEGFHDVVDNESPTWTRAEEISSPTSTSQHQKRAIQTRVPDNDDNDDQKKKKRRRNHES